MEQKANPKAKRSVFSKVTQNRLVKEYHLESKTAFLTSVVIATDLLILQDQLVDYDTLMDFCDEIYQGRGYDPDLKDPKKILAIADEIFLSLESVYKYFLRMA